MWYIGAFLRLRHASDAGRSVRKRPIGPLTSATWREDWPNSPQHPGICGAHTRSYEGRACSDVR